MDEGVSMVWRMEEAGWWCLGGGDVDRCDWVRFCNEMR